MVLEDQMRQGGMQLEWNGKIYGVKGSSSEGALNYTAAQTIIAELAKKDFPTDEINVVDQEELISEKDPFYAYVVFEMLADWEEAEGESVVQDN